MCFVVLLSRFYIRGSKTCYLQNFRNTSGGPIKTTNTNMDSALMTTTAAVTCKDLTKSNNKYTTSAGKKEYLLSCESDMNGSGDIGNQAVANFAACLDLCDKTSSCTAATYGQSNSICYMKSLYGRDINAAAKAGFDFAYLASLMASLTGQKAQSGSWGAQINFPTIPVAAAVVPQTGKLLVWSAAKSDMYTSEDPNAKYMLFADYNPGNGQVSSMTVANTNHDMFCPGISFDGTGRMIVSGGSTSKATSIFDPVANTWIAGPELKISRGYQSSTVLSNGKVFTIGGSWSGGRDGKIGEIYDPSTNKWTTLSGCPVDPMVTANQEGVYRADNHAWLVGWENGYVLQAGPSQAMHWYGASGTGSVSDAGTRPGGDAMCGIFAMYDAGKILTAGGSPSYSPSTAIKFANVMTLGNSGSAVTVQRINDMAYARVFANTVVFPNGEVLVTGGQSQAEIFTDNSPVQYPEMWSPQTNQFRVLEAKEPVVRTYHSVSMLLPGGTVFSGGGGLCGSCGSNNHFEGRIFTPPYMYKNDSLAARPAITAVSAAILALGSTLKATVSTQTSTTLAFALFRMGSVIHSVSTDQRRISLTVSAVTGKQYSLQIPSDAGIVPPGYYYLLALEGDIPSVSKIIQLKI